jgi:Flp pilus assembly protein TadD
MNRLDIAIEIAAHSVQASPKSAELRTRHGLLLAAAGLVDQGVEELTKAANLEPGNPEIARHIAALLRELGKNPEAEAWEKRADQAVKTR